MPEKPLSELPGGEAPVRGVRELGSGEGILGGKMTIEEACIRQMCNNALDLGYCDMRDCRDCKTFKVRGIKR